MPSDSFLCWKGFMTFSLLLTSQCFVFFLYGGAIIQPNDIFFCESRRTYSDEHQYLQEPISVSAAALRGGNTTSSVDDLPTLFEGVQARAYDFWGKDNPLPCVASDPDWKNTLRDPATEGFILVKPFKVGSSSASGIDLRIARNVAKRLANSSNIDMCKARCDHVRASRSYSKRDPSKSFLWTVLRDPTTRIVSQFFHFEVSRNKVEPTDANFINYIRNGPANIIHDFYLFWLSLNEYNRGQDDAVAIANQIMEDYDFIGVTERMDESFVALAMLLGLPLGDIVYLTAKTRGGYDDGGGRDEAMCTYIWPSFVSTGMKEFLGSEEWKMKSHWDLILYKAANRSLDLTIEKLGRPLFEKNLALYKKAQEMSHEYCMRKTVFPCSEGGFYTPSSETDCLWTDAGCGSDCLDEVVQKLGIES